ncbi:MAG: hypothetical protein NTZ34_07160 [Chloroflexi bacterium]|nr:hypothetical protein [Chloroflexota bacterium]
MIAMPDNLRKIDAMSWKDLRELASKELRPTPPNEQIVFEKVFKVKWPQFEQHILSLVGEQYDEIASVSKQMEPLGDLSQSEVGELAIIATLNETRYKSPKIGYYFDL